MPLSKEATAKSLKELEERFAPGTPEASKRLIDLNNFAAERDILLSRQSDRLNEIIKNQLAETYTSKTDAEIIISIYAKIQEQLDLEKDENKRQFQQHGTYSPKFIHERGYYEQLEDHDMTMFMPKSYGSVEVLAPLNRFTNDDNYAAVRVGVKAALANQKFKHIIIPVGPGHWRGICVSKTDKGPLSKYSLELFDPMGSGGAEGIRSYALQMLKECGIEESQLEITTTGPIHPQTDGYACGDFTSAWSNKKMRQFEPDSKAFNLELIEVLDAHGNQDNKLRAKSREVSSKKNAGIAKPVVDIKPIPAENPKPLFQPIIIPEPIEPEPQVTTPIIEPKPIVEEPKSPKPIVITEPKEEPIIPKPKVVVEPEPIIEEPKSPKPKVVTEPKEEPIITKPKVVVEPEPIIEKPKPKPTFIPEPKIEPPQTEEPSAPEPPKFEPIKTIEEQRLEALKLSMEEQSELFKKFLLELDEVAKSAGLKSYNKFLQELKTDFGNIASRFFKPSILSDNQALTKAFDSFKRDCEGLCLRAEFKFKKDTGFWATVRQICMGFLGIILSIAVTFMTLGIAPIAIAKNEKTRQRYLDTFFRSEPLEHTKAREQWSKFSLRHRLFKPDADAKGLVNQIAEEVKPKKEDPKPN